MSLNPQVFQKDDRISVQGAVTFETISAIQKAITQLLHAHKSSQKYQVDLAEVTLVNSAALGLLVELKKQAIAHKQTIEFLNPPERLLALAQVCSVAAWLEL